MKFKRNQASSNCGLDDMRSSKRSRVRTRSSGSADNAEPEDRISAMPNDILFNILGLLTIRDALRTTVLSKEWRPLFSSVDCQPNGVDDNELWPEAHHPRTMEDWIEQHEWRTQQITHILEGHCIVRRFIIQKTRPHQSVANIWLKRLAEQHAVEELVLEIPRVSGYIGITHNLFKCNSLRSLTLARCKWPRIHPSHFVGGYTFQHLIELTLDSMNMTATNLEDLLQRCPKLLSLSISFPRKIGGIMIRSNSLRSLTIGKSREFWHIAHLETPMLERLMWCHWMMTYINGNLLTPRLHTLGVFLDYTVVQVPTFENVRNIARRVHVNSPDGIKRTLSMLLYVPHLETLHLELHGKTLKSKCKPINFEEMIDSPITCLENSLKTIILRVDDLVQKKLALANFLLQEAQVLETMVICGNGMASELLHQDSRGSRKAQIIFRKDKKSSIELEISASNIKSADPFMP